MTSEKEKYQSSYTLDNFSSTATLANNDQIKVPISSIEKINEKSLEAEYNPHENRDLEHPNTYFGAVIHIIKSSLGTGILAIPRAFKSAGLIVGLLGTIIIGVLCTHTIHILVRASHKACRKGKYPSLGFAETAEEVFRQGPPFLKRWSSFAKNFVDYALILTHISGLAVYCVFIAESMTKLFSVHYPEMSGWDQYFKLIILVPLIICCQVRELKHLVPFSFVANTSMIIAFVITLYYMFVRIGTQKLSDRSMATGLGGLPSFFSTVIFAMEGIGTIMPVENSMTKSKFDTKLGVLNVAMTVVVVVFTSMGFFGYLSFGENTQASITYNLPNTDIAAQLCQGAISIAVFFTFMLQFYVPVDITWRKIKHRIPESRHNISQILLRTGIVLFIVAIAAAAGNHLDSIIDLVGAIFLSMLGLFIPAVIGLVMDCQFSKGLVRILWILKGLGIIGFAVAVGIFGSTNAIKNMMSTNSTATNLTHSIAAAAGQNLGPLIDIVGAIFLGTLGLLIPAALDLVSMWGDWGYLNWILFKDLVIMMFSFFVSCSGTYFAVLNIIQE